MQSIIPKNRKGVCFVCGRMGYTEEHHIFEGANRNASEQRGLKVDICLDHHRGYNGVHTSRGKEIMDWLHEIGQQAYEEWMMEHKGVTQEEARDMFRKEFIRSYL